MTTQPSGVAKLIHVTMDSILRAPAPRDGDRPIIMLGPDEWAHKILSHARGTFVYMHGISRQSLEHLNRKHDKTISNFSAFLYTALVARGSRAQVDEEMTANVKRILSVTTRLNSLISNTVNSDLVDYLNRLCRNPTTEESRYPTTPAPHTARTHRPRVRLDLPHARPSVSRPRTADYSQSVLSSIDRNRGNFTMVPSIRQPRLPKTRWIWEYISKTRALYPSTHIPLDEMISNFDIPDWICFMFTNAMVGGWWGGEKVKLYLWELYNKVHCSVD